LQYDIAGIGSRSAAYGVDFAIQCALFIVLGMLFLAGSILSDQIEALGTWLVVTLIVIWAMGLFIVSWAYFPIFEIAWSGQTPGKRAIGLRVIRENGYPIRASDAIVRNLLRIIDGNFIGLLVMLLNVRSKRLGDFAAGTIVIREARVPALLELAAETSAEPGRGPMLSGEDATLVRDFLARRSSINQDARVDLGARLAARLASRYGLSTPGPGEVEQFLERLVS
jgi:uncharacterized RDD family membrane protein YckC